MSAHAERAFRVPWIADLLRHGLLQKSFVPPQPQQDLRELTRYRAQVTAARSAVGNRIRKLLEGANIKLGSVVSDVMGYPADGCWRRSSKARPWGSPSARPCAIIGKL